MKDGRTTIRVDRPIMDKIKVLAKNNNRTINAEIEALLKDSVGIKGYYPCIMRSGTELMYFTPFGYYGECTAPIFNRLVKKGNLPITGKSWLDDFDSMEEACDTLGCEEICRQSSNGLVITDWETFNELYTKFNS